MKEGLIENIFKVIGTCDTNDLNDIVIELIRNHVFTSKDSIQHLIDMLEDLREELNY